ncbi:MAG: hypothetical protein NC041_07940 [Bacteroides sp.]|nr:hypothetical protein [Prevotella sp.]MCM1408386.1 hypothetical protein [Treponema brennaborense]MCM1470383.1 hypothetical protein [Bacteroides sp.]
MKRISATCALLLLAYAMGFSESNSTADATTETVVEDSVLNLKFLVHEPKFLNFTKYQNLAGESLSYKETNVLLDSVPQNAQVMKKYRSWRTSALVFAGMLAACVVTDAVYLCGDDMPHREAVITTASAMGLCSGFAAILAGEASAAHYLMAVDNFNMGLFSSKK